ncbi:FAD-dependent monooxygenase [Pelagibacteraceae bacterium]|nr:FAD-dependent monooxygenase [Pelagibacteraceae bacterium]
MKNQKICIIGDGLAGLSTTLTLKNLDLDIDVFYKKTNKFKEDNRTTAISETNFQFLSKQIKLKKKYFWPCKKISLFYENKEEKINFLNYSGEKKNLMYIFENKKIRSSILSHLKKSKNVKLFNKNITSVNSDDTSIIFDNKKKYYDLIILCLGNNSVVYNDLFKSRNIIKDYNEVAITGIVTHNLKIENPSQYFKTEGPLAILPFKKNKLSFVWSLQKNFYQQNYKKLINLVNSEIENNYKKIKYKVLNLQTFPIYMNLRTQYSKKNILIFGEGIHSIHPVAGQGFNLVIRDIKKLKDIIGNNIKLGLQIKDSLILDDFYITRSAENNIFGLGINLTHSFFKNKTFFEPFKTTLLKNIGDNKIIKKISSSLSDKGLL